MFATRQKVARSVVKPRAYRALGRYSTSEQGKEDAEQGHHEHAAPKNEPLGLQLYIVLALIPASYALYHLSRTSEDGTRPGLSNLIERYSYHKDRWSARNSLHTAMIEQAAFDRHLFHHSKGSNHIDLKFPEVFNTGSPYNVPAGQGGINLDKVVAHYQKINSEAEEKKIAALAAKDSSKE